MRTVYHALIGVAAGVTFSVYPAAVAQSAPPPAPAQSPTAAAGTEPGAEAVDFGTPSPAVTRRVSSLIQQLRRPSTMADRERLLGQLVDIGVEGIPLIISEMERRTRNTWALMVYALGAIGDERVIPIIRKQAKGQSAKSLMDVYYALSLAGDDTALTRALRSTYATLAFDQGMTVVDYIAGSMGPESVDVLMREIPRRSRQSRMAGLSALGTVCDDRAVDFLLAWSERPEPMDRRFAIMALARIGDARASERLIRAMSDEDQTVREAAMEGVGYLRTDKAVEALATKVSTLEPSMELHRGLWSLGLIGGPHAAQTLREQLKDSPETQRRWVMQAIANSKDPAVLDILTETALVGQNAESVPAAQGLSEIPGQAAQDAMLRVCSESRSETSQSIVALELTRRRDARATPCVMQVLRKDLSHKRGLSHTSSEILKLLPLASLPGAAESLDRLVDEVAAPTIQYQLGTAAKAIRLVHKNDIDVDTWIELLTNGTSEEIDLAIARLGDLGDPRAIEPLQRLFGRIEPERSHLIPSALGRIGSPRATPFLIQLLTDDLYQAPSLTRAREEAAQALASFSQSPHVAEQLAMAFENSRGRLFTALMAYAKIRGAEGIPELIRMKRLLLNRRGATQVNRHERVNWAIRMLRAGKEIPISEVRDPFQSS